MGIKQLFILGVVTWGNIGSSAYVQNILHPYKSALINLSEYDSTVRPPGLAKQDNPVNVSVNMYVIRIDNVDHTKNEFKMQIYFREEWSDPRLAYKDTGYGQKVVTNEVQLFWKPDLFFVHEKKGFLHTITKTNIFASLQPNGEILQSSRLSLVLHCPMKMWSFPFDTQVCRTQIESYGYTTDDMILRWKSGVAVQVAKDFQIPGYTLKETDFSEVNFQLTSGNYSMLEMAFEFARDPAPYIVRVFLPISLLVVASWSSFWLSANAATERLTIGVVTTFTTTFLIFREEDALRLPTLTALDIWVAVSALFVFSAFFEYILVTYVTGRNKEEIKKLEDSSRKILWVAFPSDVPIVDTASKIVFPAGYILFHVMFLPMVL